MHRALLGGAAVMVLLLGTAATVSARDERPFPHWSRAKTVAYCRDGGVPLSMTLFAPPPSATPPPVVLQVHGGGWKGGGRFRSLSQSTVAERLVSEGMAVASVDYRLAPKYRWPDPIVDVACAVRYLRANSLALGIDGTRIGAWGDSSGGQLVSMLGTADTAQWRNGQHAGEKSTVQAVVDEFGVTDLTSPELPPYTSKLVSGAFGSVPGHRSWVLSQASPVTYVKSGDPPFLILQGTADAVVPVAQSVELATKLRQAGDPVRLVLVRGGYHGLLNRNERPGPSTVDNMVVRFFAATLRR